MDSKDFNRLHGLLAKLEIAAKHASQQDASFNKYHHQSVDAIKNMALHLSRLEQGLKTARFMPPSHHELNS